jgi:hypothetical protein
MSQSPYKIRLSLSVLNLLGPNLYSNIAAVLSEIVANAWDADATKVEININLANDEITIKDNGLGMSAQDINDKFLYIGYLKRLTKTSAYTSSGRHVMGRKGIGKLASFSFADEFQILSNNGREKSGCLLRWQDIRKAYEQEKDYTPEILDTSLIDFKHGTLVILRGLTSEKTVSVENDEAVRRRLARRFLTIGKADKFEVEINGVSITRKDYPFYADAQNVWYFGDDSKKYLELFPHAKRKHKISNQIDGNGTTYKIRGWIASVGKPSDLHADENDKIALYAYGKLIQEDIISELQESQAYAEYLVGNIEADFIDADDDIDIVTSDRQRVIQDDPRYVLLRKFILPVVRRIGRDWNLWRGEDKAPGLDRPDVKEWYDTLNESNKRKAVRVVRKIDEINNIDEPERDHLYSVGMKRFDVVKDTRGMKTLDESSFLKLLQPEQIAISTHLNKDMNHQPLTSLKPTEKEDTFRRPSPPQTNASANFREIQKSLQKFILQDSLKEIAIYDLEQARLAYETTAYKASIVMLGAVLEGAMLGTICRKDVLDKMIKDDVNAPKVILNLGLLNPSLNYELITKNIAALSFEDYKNVIHLLIPGIEKLKIDGIQVFRNTIHPWLAIQEPKIYANIDATRVMHLLTSLQILLRHISEWKP